MIRKIIDDNDPRLELFNKDAIIPTFERVSNLKVQAKDDFISQEDVEALKQAIITYPGFITLLSGVITWKISERMKGEFFGRPRAHPVDRNTVEDFVAKVKSLQKSVVIPPTHQWYVRFYLGFSLSNQYGIVAVPYHGRSTDHSEDTENSLWSPANAFFGLLPSLKKVSTDINECRNEIINIDSSGTLAVSHEWSEFENLIDLYFAKGYEELVLNFGRIYYESDQLTLIIFAYDMHGNIVSIEYGGRVLGYCFDQAGVIPPPGAVPDLTIVR